MSDNDTVDTTDVLGNIVNQKVAAGDMFTALDISRTAQWKDGLFERHDNLKGIVHQMFHDAQMGNYSRTLITLPGIPDSIWLYYDPNVSDPSTYKSVWMGVRPGSPPNADAQAQQGTVPALGFSNDDAAPQQAAPQGQQGDFDRDKRGRLWVSKPLVAQLNVNPGDQVFAIVEPNQVKITTDVTKLAGLDYRTYKVDRHGNIAISRLNFDKAGINNPSVNANVVNGEIVIALP